MPPLRFFLCFQFFCHLQEKRLVNDSGAAALYACIRVYIYADIQFIPEHSPEGVFIPQSSPFGAYTSGIQIVDDVHEGDAVGNLLENIPDDLRLRFHHSKATVRALAEAVRDRAIIHFAFECVRFLPPADVLREVRRIIFCRTFKYTLQKDALGTLRYIFFC